MYCRSENVTAANVLTDFSIFVCPFTNKFYVDVLFDNNLSSGGDVKLISIP